MYNNMWKIIVFSALFAVCLSQTVVDLNIICKYVSIMNCNLFEKHPVCGTNNITYESQCTLSRAHCRDRSLNLAHNGSCSDSAHTGGENHDAHTGGENHGAHTGGEHHGSQVTYEFFCRNFEHKHCGDDVEVVCGSDGKTYNNFCLFEKARCLDRDLFIKDYVACP